MYVPLWSCHPHKRLADIIATGRGVICAPNTLSKADGIARCWSLLQTQWLGVPAGPDETHR